MTSELLTVLRGARYRYATEDELQQALAAALTGAGYTVEREVRLNSRDRIDLLVDRVGIEVKIAGERRTVERQLARYSESDLVDELVLVTTRARHRPPAQLNWKPVHVVSLLGAGL